MESMYSRRTFLKLAGLTAGAVGLGACAPSSDDEGAKTPQKSDSTPTNFSLAAWTLADDLSKAGVQGLMTAYAAEKSIEITPVPIAFPDYVNQLTLKVRANQFAGAAQLDIAWLSGIAALGKLRDLGSYADGAGYTETALTSGQLDGKQYGLPWTTGAIGMIVNQKALNAVGIDTLPTKIDDFEAALAEIKGSGLIPYAASTKVAQLKDILIWMQTFGSELIDGDEVTIGDDASVEAVAWYKGLYDKKLIAPDVERIDARTLFAQGKAAMYDDAIVGKDVVVKEAADKDLINQIAPAPRPVVKDGDKPRTQQWGHIAVVVEGEGADTASDFAKWATSDTDAVLKYFETVSLPPTTEEALGSDVVKNDKFTTAFSESITATATPNPFWRFPQYAQMETVVSEHVQSVLIGRASPEEALGKAKAAVQALV